MDRPYMARRRNKGSRRRFFLRTTQGNSTRARAIARKLFWFAGWPAQDYLRRNPTLVTPPSGWTGNITHSGSADGWGIQFVASSTASDIAPGQSLDFNFETLDTPAELSGYSVYYPNVLVATSMAYAQIFNPGVEFVVAVPEPSAVGLLLLGSLGFWLARGSILTRPPI